jgi:drug/metabolite transporter (DMT)-like permease
MNRLGDAEAGARRAVLTGSLFALTGAAAYGINIVGARVCAGMGLTGADIVVYRAAILLPLLGLLAATTGRRLTLAGEERPQVLRFAGFSVGTALFYTSSLKYLPVPAAVTIFYTYPLIVILLTPYLDRVALSGRRWVVAIAAFIGVMLAVGPQVDALDPRGVALAFAGSLACAGMFITASRVTTDSYVTFFWCQMLVLPFGLGFAWLNGGLAETDLMRTALLPFMINAGGFFIGFLFQILAASRISAPTSGILFLFEPVVAILTAALLLGEHVTPLQAAGMLLIIAALAYDTLDGLRRSPRLAAFDP